MPPARELKSLPIFICGPARSGTTLLVRLFDSHPQIAVLPEETYVYQDLLLCRRLSWFVVHLAEILDLPDLLGILSRRPFRWFAFGGRDQLRTRLIKWTRTFGITGTGSEVIIDGLLRNKGAKDGYWWTFLDLYDALRPGSLGASRYWLEKTPSSERFTALTEQLFPGDSRYLHIIRDPRDVVASWLQRRSKTQEERDTLLIFVCYLWSLSVDRCARGVKLYPKRYCVLRYEDLVCRPDNIMASVSRFLEIDFDRRLLTPTQFGQPISANSSYKESESAFTIIPSQIGRFAEVLTESETTFIERLLHSQISACGYALQRPATDTRPGPPPLPSGASRSWKSRVHGAQAWSFQRKFAGKSISFL